MAGSFFPECVAKGSRFALEVWHGLGLGRVHSTPQLFATVHKRSRCGRYGCGSAAPVATFGSLKHCATSFRVVGVALRDITTCFMTGQGGGEEEHGRKGRERHIGTRGRVKIKIAIARRGKELRPGEGNPEA